MRQSRNGSGTPSNGQKIAQIGPKCSLSQIEEGNPPISHENDQRPNPSRGKRDKVNLGQIPRERERRWPNAIGCPSPSIRQLNSLPLSLLQIGQNPQSSAYPFDWHRSSGLSHLRWKCSWQVQRVRNCQKRKPMEESRSRWRGRRRAKGEEEAERTSGSGRKSKGEGTDYDQWSGGGGEGNGLISDRRGVRSWSMIRKMGVVGGNVWSMKVRAGDVRSMGQKSNNSRL